MRHIIFAFFLCLFSLNQYAQTNNYSDKRLIGDGVYILPSQLIFPEIILTYEHFIKEKVSLSYSLGYKIPTGTGSKFEPFGNGLIADYEYQYMFNKFSNAIYFSIAPSYFIGTKRNYFVQCELFNRFYWIDNKQFSFDNDEIEKFDCVRSERNNVTGLKLLLGLNKQILISNSLFFNTIFYGGFGLRFKVYHYENVNNKIIDSNNNVSFIPFQEDNGSLIAPSIQLGIKIGLAKRIKN